MIDDRDLFRQFVGEMDKVIRENDTISQRSQRRLLNDLFRAEKNFKKWLLASSHGRNMYKRFMKFILKERGNKLLIRPYLRERQNTFSNRVFPILDRENHQGLHKFRINYLFAKWIIENMNNKPKRLVQEYENILSLRNLLCENNLPLSINRAKLFWSKTPRAHLEYMDLIQDASKGLLEAIDNFVPPYRTVFRSVAIGRMGLNMGDDYSATLVKLPPKDRRILYRARKAKLKNNDISGKELQSFVNESFSKTTAADIELIEAAANQVVSIDSQDSHGRSMSEIVADPMSVDDVVAEADLKNKMLILVRSLDILEIKVILMKNGDMYGIG